MQIDSCKVTVLCALLVFSLFVFFLNQVLLEQKYYSCIKIASFFWKRKFVFFLFAKFWMWFPNLIQQQQKIQLEKSNLIFEYDHQKFWFRTNHTHSAQAENALLNLESAIWNLKINLEMEILNQNFFFLWNWQKKLSRFLWSNLVY